MARKRRGRRRGGSGWPLLALLVLAALAAWLLWPHGRPGRHRHVAAVATPRSAATATPPPAQTPALAAPAATPSATPPVATATPTVNPNGPEVAIIVDDCGQWLDTERGYIALPIPLTISVLPYVHYTSLIQHEAAAAGKGVIVHLPMEPVSHIYPGPGEIKTAMDNAQVVAQTEDDIAQVPLATGVNNHEGSEASADPRVMNDVIGVLKARGLFFVDSMTSAKSVGAAVARAQGVPTASRDVFLDNRASVAYSEAMLERTVEVARRDGSAIAIGHPRPTTLEALRDMYPRMEAQGVRFVLVSQLVR